MKILRGVLGASLAAVLIAAAVPADLDVEIPPGNPFDSIKMSRRTPTGGAMAGTATWGVTTPPPPPDPNVPAGTGTVAQGPEIAKKEPPKPPAGLPGVGAPSTSDWPKHLHWAPKDRAVKLADDVPTAVTGATPSMPGAPPPPLPPFKWEFKEYPPSVSNSMYVYCMSRFLMAMLHRSMVSERELTGFLIEIGYPGRYAATACAEDKEIEPMAREVMDAVGPPVASLPMKPLDETAQRVYFDLITHYPYDPGFGSFILSQPSEVTLPVLIKICRTQKHPLLVRNAVFILRCFDNPEAVPVLKDLLTKSRDKVVRYRALAALTRWRDPSIVPWLAEQLGKKDVVFHSAVLWALGRIGSPDGIDPILEHLGKHKADRETVWAALPALGWIADEALPHHRKKIEDFLVSIRAQVAAFPDPPGYDDRYTRVLAPDPPEAVRTILSQRLVMVLARCGRPEDVEAFKKLDYSQVLRPNSEFFTETQRKVR